jgi:hypothetical protein
LAGAACALTVLLPGIKSYWWLMIIVMQCQQQGNKAHDVLLCRSCTCQTVAAAQQYITALQCAALTHLASHEWPYTSKGSSTARPLINCCSYTHLDV